jgi:hypothetical protein
MKYQQSVAYKALERSVSSGIENIEKLKYQNGVHHGEKRWHRKKIISHQLNSLGVANGGGSGENMAAASMQPAAKT